MALQPPVGPERTVVKKISEMTAQEHLERAAVLMQMLDDRFDENGKLTKMGSNTGWTITPVQLTLADLHLGLAMAKEEL